MEEDYYRMKLQWMSITEDQENRFSGFRDRKALIGWFVIFRSFPRSPFLEKDVSRTDRSHPFFSRTRQENLKMLRDILMTYCMFDFDLGW